MDVDTRLLRYFVAVAEELSFTRAARALFVAQPALSRQIRQLETRLGVDLFVRAASGIALTAAGEVLLPAARQQVAEWQRTARQVRTAAAAENGVLRVGFVASGGGPVARRARAEFAARHPEATVEPKRFDWGGEPQALRDGLVDVAFVWLPADVSGLHVETVATEPRWVGLSVRHRLAARDSVTIGDLRDEPLLWTRVAPAEWVDWWAVNPRPDGSTPVWGPENENVEEMLEQVAGTDAICIGARSMADYYRHPDLTWRPITDIEPLRIALAWPQGTTNPLVADFVAVVLGLRTDDSG